MKILEKTKSVLENEIILLGKETNNRVLVIGVFHGDEPQGKFLIENYLENNQSSLLFIPCLNPDGMINNCRTNFNKIDLNRNFPTTNWALTEKNEFFGGYSPASEPETKFVIDVINKYQPKIVLTLHAPFKIVNFDGDAEKFAREISKITKYPVEASIGYPTPGSFGTYAGVELKIPTITLELDEECPVESLIKPVTKVFQFLEKC